MSYLAEQNVVGSLLIDNDSIGKVYGMLEADMFSSELLGRMYLEFQRGYDNRYEVNQVVLLQKLTGESWMQSIVLEEIRNCISVTVTSASIKSYAEVVKNDYRARQLDRILSCIQVSPNDISGQIGKLITDLEGLRDNRAATSKSLPQIVAENKDKYFTDSAANRINIGFPKLDDLLGGLEGGDMIVIGARPAVGKSAFVTQITTYFAEQGKKVGFYNLEMSDKQMYERFVVSQSGIGLTRLRRAVRFLGDEKERFDRANEVLSGRSNIVISTGSKSVSEIRAESRHMDYDVIVIDYMQLLKADTQYKGNRYAEVGAISKAIKNLAMELNIPIIALSQLNRVSEARDTKEPTMAELREAGDIEQDASVIILLWNRSQDDKSIKGCKIEKDRQGLTGTVTLKFDGDKMAFYEMQATANEVARWEKVDDDCPFK